MEVWVVWVVWWPRPNPESWDSSSGPVGGRRTGQRTGQRGGRRPENREAGSRARTKKVLSDQLKRASNEQPVVPVPV